MGCRELESKPESTPLLSLELLVSCMSAGSSGSVTSGKSRRVAYSPSSSGFGIRTSGLRTGLVKIGDSTTFGLGITAGAVLPGLFTTETCVV